MRKLGLALFLLCLGLAPAQAQQVTMPPPAGTVAILCAYNTSPPAVLTGNVAFAQCDSNGKLITSSTVTFPTIGAAVPATGIYNGINVGGTLRGLTGLSTGSIFPATVAVVDASGAQITTFGTAWVNTNKVEPWDGTNTITVKAASTAPVATDTSQVVALNPNSPGVVALGQATKSASVPVTIANDQGTTIVALSSQYPNGATALTSSTTGTTGATTTTLAGVSNKTTFVCGFTITSDATAALAGTATVTGTISGTLSFIQNVGGATAAGILTQPFSPCIPASATNTGIAINSVAAGTGGNTAVTAWGYQL